MKFYDIEEYGSNYPESILDPKRIAEDPSEFYDGIARRQTEMQGFRGARPSQGGPENGRKSLWDAQNVSVSTPDFL